MNGTPLPNWAKLIVLGAGVGIAIGVNQVALKTLADSQLRIETTMNNSIQELRTDIKTHLVTKDEYNIMAQRVESNARRIDILDKEVLDIQYGRHK